MYNIYITKFDVVDPIHRRTLLQYKPACTCEELRGHIRRFEQDEIIFSGVHTINRGLLYKVVNKYYAEIYTKYRVLSVSGGGNIPVLVKHVRQMILLATQRFAIVVCQTDQDLEGQEMPKKKIISSPL